MERVWCTWILTGVNGGTSPGRPRTPNALTEGAQTSASRGAPTAWRPRERPEERRLCPPEIRPDLKQVAPHPRTKPPNPKPQFPCCRAPTFKTLGFRLGNAAVPHASSQRLGNPRRAQQGRVNGGAFCLETGLVELHHGLAHLALLVCRGRKGQRLGLGINAARPQAWLPSTALQQAK